MAVRRVLQSTCVAVWCAGTAVVVTAALRDPGPDVQHPAVVGSAGLTVAWMLLGWALILAGRRIARLVWTLGAVALLVHIVLAFAVGHGWSHAAAVEHVREVGGYGAGIVVNYLFAAVWLGDVVWWWADPVGRADRPPWVRWAVHGFLLFVVVNAAVVFGPPGRRVWYTAAFAALALLWLARGRR